MRTSDIDPVVLRVAFCSLICATVSITNSCGDGNLAAQPHSPYRQKLAVRVSGGRQPVSGSAIALYEAGTSAAGSGAAVLATATSDSSGSFNIASFTCQHPNSQLYVTATGGDAGNGVNSNIVMIAMLGPCSNLPDNVNIDEVSTVAAAYSFAQFMNPTDPTQIGTTGIPASVQYIGMANAGAMLTANVVNVATGQASSVLASSPNSPATLNTLADILVYCVDAPAPFSNCTDLYATVPSSNGNPPTNTLEAALDIALKPGQNVTAIYNLLMQVPVALPFTPVLTSAPNDWLLALKFIPGDISVPRGMAIDQLGDIWIANATGGADSTGSITELSPLGAEISPSGGYTAGGTLNHPEDIFIGAGGGVWVTNDSGNTVEAIDGGGNVVVAPFGSSQFFSPTGIVTDSFGQVWVADNGAPNTSEELTVSTTSGSFNFWVGGFGLGTATRIATDTTASPNIMWVSNSGAGGISRIVNNGTSSLTGGAITGGGQGGQQGVSIDNTGNVWVANTDVGSVTKIDASTLQVSLGPISLGGIDSGSMPYGLATDSANNVWVNNFGSSTITELDSNGNVLGPAGGFTAGGLIAFPRNGIAIDRSGNVWVLDDDFPPPFVTVLLGAAAPVATPRSSGRPIAPQNAPNRRLPGSGHSIKIVKPLAGWHRNYTKP